MVNRRHATDDDRDRTHAVLDEVMLQLEGRRKALSLRQRGLARLARTGSSMLNELIHGKRRNVELETLIRLAHAMALEVEITLRPRRLFGYRWGKGASRYVFSCPCGAELTGPKGEVNPTYVQPDKCAGMPGKLQLWMGQGASASEQLALHLADCALGQVIAEVQYV
jgi:transcriptional regulator with XRE-family HTH domain